jgi:hypothetical protein
MKRLTLTLVSLGILFIASTYSHADSLYPKRSNYPASKYKGATSTGTMYAVSVTTTPALLLSTGAYTNSVILPSGATRVFGQLMLNRTHIEIQNGTTNSVWIDFDVQVSSMAGIHRGRKIVPGEAVSYDSNIPFYITSGNNTDQAITVTQER